MAPTAHSPTRALSRARRPGVTVSPFGSCPRIPTSPPRWRSVGSYGGECREVLMADVDLQAVRDEVAAWLAENWDPERPLAEWRAMLADSGWGCPTWPRDCYGRGRKPEAARAGNKELERVGGVGTPRGGGRRLG